MRIVELIRSLEHVVETHDAPDDQREAAALAANMLYRARHNLGIDWDSSTENLYNAIQHATSPKE